MKISEDALLGIVFQIHDALTYAYNSNKNKPIIHRDLTPQNLIISFEGILKIIDFGLAAIEGEETEFSTKVEGKEGYLPPELKNGQEYTHYSDWYSVGVMLWEIYNKKRFKNINHP